MALDLRALFVAKGLEAGVALGGESAPSPFPSECLAYLVRRLVDKNACQCNLGARGDAVPCRGLGEIMLVSSLHKHTPLALARWHLDSADLLPPLILFGP